MIRMARFSTLIGLGLAISSFIGLVARFLPPFGIGFLVICLLVLVALGGCLLMGHVLDDYFGWQADTSLALSIGALVVFLVGGLIGWSIG